MKTTEGWMDLNFENMELYKQSGDLLCPMVPMPLKAGCWVATCPMTGKCYTIQRWLKQASNTCFYAVAVLTMTEVISPQGFLVMQYDQEPIGKSEEFDLDV